MKKRLLLSILVFMIMCIPLISCARNKNSLTYVSIDEEAFKEREDVNGMQDSTIASDGNNIYMLGNAEGLIYRVDLENHKVEINCDDLMCEHEGENCSAKLPISELSVYSLRRNGDKVYALGNRIFEISKNSMKELGHGQYGHYGNHIIFGNYIAYFAEQDVMVVEDLDSGKEVQRFEDIVGYVQGNFYYKDCLYLITQEMQLVKLNIATGEKEVVEKKGATRASVYDGYIYYIKISTDTDSNHLIKMDPGTLEKGNILEGVFYYNMLGDKLYYSTYPERELWCSDINGKNPKLIDTRNEFGWIWTFANSDRILLDGKDSYTYYVLDENQNVNYEQPIVREK